MPSHETIVMPYLFTCPHCQTRTMVDDQYRGQSGRCVTCNQPIQIPNFANNAISPGLRRSRPLAWVLASFVTILFAGVIVVMLVRQGGQTISQLQASRERVGSMRNLEKIASAMNAYAADHGQYPPAALKNPSGQVMHSWRVLLLPYLGEEDLYNSFRMDLPWNNQHNMIAARGTVPNAYQHPNASSLGMSEVASYFVITGVGTVFPPLRPLAPGEVNDNPSQTILVIEAMPGNASRLWTEPVDLDFTLMRGDLMSPGGNEPGGWIAGGVAMATVDGRGHFLDQSTPPLVVRALVTPQGGEQLADDTLD